MELRCDNTAAIVLATGEGSWRTKSAANKVNAVREKVEAGSLKVTYVGTKDQCADSLTKFLRGGPDQIKAREHLSLVSLENCTNGRDAHAKACRLRDSFRATGVFGPRICRVVCSAQGDLVSELSDPATRDLPSTLRKRKRLGKKWKRSHFMSRVTMLARSKKRFVALRIGELLNRVAPCTAIKRAMVQAFIKQKIEADGDALMGLSEAPDYGGDDDLLSPVP